jgi:hypothetical protein
MVAAIEWSWDLLDQAERDLLGRLAALPGEFSLAMATATASVTTAADLEACLLRLAERSLISVALAADRPARYRLLTTIRAFAAEQAPSVAEQVRHAHARYCCELAQAEIRVRCELGRPQPPPFDEANFLAALTWAAAGEPAVAERLLGTRLPAGGGGGARSPGPGNRLRPRCSRALARDLRLAGTRPGQGAGGRRLQRLAGGGHRFGHCA